MGGVQIKNCTAVPLKIQLCQVGVLYHDLVQPGECFTRTTGAVHFTIRATVSKEDDTNWKNTILPVLGVLLVSLGAVVTAGVGAVLSGGALLTAGVSAASGVTGVTLVGGAVTLTSARLMTAGGVVLTKELAEALSKEAKESHVFINSPGWYLGGKNELEIRGGPKFQAYSKGFKYDGSPLYIVAKNNSERRS